MTGETLRLDKWLWFARFVKTRSLATRLVTDGRMRINGAPTQKAHYSVKPGDVLTFPLGPHIRVIKVVALGSRRGPASEAQMLYEDFDPPRPASPSQAAATPPFENREPGAGRPTKRDGRRIAQLKSTEPR
ncbi:MAG TPA: RNA-binding S4 domain-containing protein [Dongiaceae bacterium]|nr:RNA-binding S4 domain-containing protein [Dongiaceae bacterium]